MLIRRMLVQFMERKGGKTAVLLSTVHRLSYSLHLSQPQVQDKDLCSQLNDINLVCIVLLRKQTILNQVIF